MSTRVKERSVLEVSGVVRRVDVVSREIEVLVESIPQTFDVPTVCPIFLHEERVKLRLLQTYDHVHLAYECQEGRPIARAIRANWRHRSPADIRAALLARAAEFRSAAPIPGRSR